MRAKSIAVTVGIAALALSSFARADQASEARAHYQSATTHFAVGDFAKAADEYQAAYMLKPDPALLYNAAQSYRLAGNQEKALILYKNYVQLYPNEANVDEVRAQIAKLKDAIAAADQAKTSPPTGTKEPSQPMSSGAAATAAPTAASPSATASPEPATAPAPQAAAEPHERTPVYKKWWLWTIVGAVVVGGVVTAAVLATSSNGTWNNAPEVGPGRMGLGVRW